MVLGIRSSEVGCTDFRLILDLKRVLIKVDFPKPLCPGETQEEGGPALRRGQVTSRDTCPMTSADQAQGNSSRAPPSQEGLLAALIRDGGGRAHR